MGTQNYYAYQFCGQGKKKGVNMYKITYIVFSIYETNGVFKKYVFLKK